MKITRQLILGIVATLFVLLCGISYFFYKKFDYIISYINNQINMCNMNLEGQMEAFRKNTSQLMGEKQTEEEQTEEQELNEFLQDLTQVTEDDINVNVPETNKDFVDLETELILEHETDEPEQTSDDLVEDKEEQELEDEEDVMMLESEDESESEENSEDESEIMAEDLLQDLDSESEDEEQEITESFDDAEFSIDCGGDVCTLDDIESGACTYEFKRGKNKGTQCNKPCSGSKCNAHKDK